MRHRRTRGATPPHHIERASPPIPIRDDRGIRNDHQGGAMPTVAYAIRAPSAVEQNPIAAALNALPSRRRNIFALGWVCRNSAVLFGDPVAQLAWRPARSSCPWRSLSALLRIIFSTGVRPWPFLSGEFTKSEGLVGRRRSGGVWTLRTAPDWLQRPTCQTQPQDVFVRRGGPRAGAFRARGLNQKLHLKRPSVAMSLCLAARRFLVIA